MVNKVTLVPVTGANNITNINDNFSKLERVVNDTMLSRKVVVGQPNQVLSPIDMNGQRLINLPDPQTSGEPITFKYVEGVQASVDGLEDLVVQAQGQLTTAQLANQQAQGILVDTRVIQVDVIAKAAQVNTQAGQVAAQAAQVNTQTGQVTASAAAAASSASASAGSAATASTQAGNAASSASAANTSKLAAEAAVTAANASRDAAAVSATNSAGSASAAATSATDAANAAASIDQPFLLNRANHTGTQAISTVVNLQTSLDAKKNKSDNTTIAQGGTGATTAAGARTNLGLGAAAVAAITGAVSQSGGVPTGAIMQRGNNVNGYYHRAADGTQICWQRYNVGSVSITVPALSASLVGSWTYPIAFLNNSDIAVSGSAGFDGGEGFNIRMFAGVNEASVQIQNVTNASKIAAFATTGIYVIAIGRWY